MREPPDDADAIRATYRGYAASSGRRRAWSGANPGNVAIRGELLAHLLRLAARELRGRGHVLDIGCGGGFWLAALAETGVPASRLHGIDLLEERAAAASSRLPASDIRCGDAAELPYDDETMSLVLLLTVLSSLPRESAAFILAEARRVVAPSGKVLVYEPRIPNPLNSRTRMVRGRELEAALGPEAERHSLTLLPALARRLGRMAPRAYPVLARVPALRTHLVRVFEPKR